MLTDSYIKGLVTPQPTKNVIKRNVKAFDVEFLRTFAIAQNVEGNTNIPLEAIGAPYRLAANKDGTIKISASGKPSIRVAKEIVAFGTMIHNNIVAGIQADTDRVFAEKKEACEAMVATSVKAGQPIINSDEKKLAVALKLYAEAEAAAAKAEAAMDAPTPATEPELVPVA